MITLPVSITPPLSYIEREYITISPDVSLSTAIATLIHPPRCVVLYGQEPESPPQAPVAPMQTCILVVNAEQQLIGLLTERDIVRFVARQIDLETLRVSEAMTRNVITHPEAEQTDPVNLIHQMRHHRIRHLPVVDLQNRPTGLITPSSIRATLQPADLLKWRLVEEAMSTRLIHAMPSASIAQIAQQMAEERVSCVVLAQSTATGALLPLGIVTEHDIVQFQLLQLSSETTAESVMSTPLFTVPPDISVWAAHQIMQTHHVRRLGVTNPHGELIGVLTQTSILQSVDVAELHQVITTLQQRVQVLQQENMELLEQINQDLQVRIDAQSDRLATQLERETVLLDIALRIRSSLNLETILQTTVQEVRDRLRCDRVVIARFHRSLQASSDWRAQVVVEAVEHSHWSILGRVLHDDCLEQDWLLSHREDPEQAMVSSHPIASSVCSDLDGEGIQARASLSVPIWVDQTLWGILVTHQVTACRIWKPDEQQFLEQLAVHVAIAIQQATLLNQVQESKAELEARVTERTDQLQQELAGRERIEASLRESEERFQAFMTHAPMLSWITDSNGVMIYANAAWMEFVGTTPETTIGHSIRDLIPAAIADKYLANNQQVIETGKAIEVIEPAIHSDGSQHQYLIRKFPIQFHQNQHETWIGGIGLDITERLEADLKLRSSEEKFRQLAGNIRQVFFLLSATGEMLYISPAYETTWQRSAEELYADPRAWLQAVHPDDRPRVETKLHQQIALQTSFNDTYRIVQPNGEIRWIMARSFPFRNESGQVVRFTGIAEDVTFRKQAEEVMQHQLQRALLLRHITDEIRQSLDFNQIFQAAAQQVGEAFQANRCTIHVYDERTSDKLPVVGEHLIGSYVSIRHIPIPIDGNPHAQQLLSQEGAIAIDQVDTDPLLMPMMAIVEQVQVKSMLAVGTFYQGKPNGIIGLHQCDRVRHWHKDEIELIEAVASQLGIAIAHASLLEQEVRQREELVLKNVALEKAKREADAANRAKSEFLANMSHEIRTPLNAVLGFADLLHDSVVDPKAQSYLDTITSSGQTLLALINDILDLSKIEAGKLQLHYEPVNLRQLVDEIRQVFSQKALEKGIQIQVAIADETPLCVFLDEVRLRQILFNVVGNALKFTSSGSIQISLQPYPSVASKPGRIGIRMAVHDTGIGIAPEDQQHIFGAFTQSEGQPNRKYGGTGLGLAITQRLVHMMQGVITLQSTLGQGSTFTFEFSDVAIASESIPTSTYPQHDADLNQFKPSTILVVDDVTSNRDLIAGYFAGTDHTLLMAKSGAEALELAQTQLPDVILLDLRMPVLDGRDVAIALKQTPSTQHIPVLILTAAVLQENLDMVALQSICAGILRKPINQATLVSALKTVLELKATSPAQSSPASPSSHPLDPSPSPSIWEPDVDSAFPAREFMSQLRQIQTTQWLQLRKTLVIQDLEQFTNHLLDLGQQYRVLPLIEYAQTLQQEINDFDWDRIPETVERFRQILDRLDDSLT